MKKVILSCAVISAILGAQSAKAQLVDEKNVTITMDLQPILQLDMTGPQNIDFVFDQIAEYVGGITQYGVTQLKVSSSVSWDLYAVGYASGGTNWDVQVEYGTAGDALATNVLPCALLELRQNQANLDYAGYAGLVAGNNDYNTAFGPSPVITGANNIYASANPYTLPTNTQKYIAGGTAGTDYVPGGTYLVLGGGPPTVVGAASKYYYNIDYRIVPGLPAIFPNAAGNDGITPLALNLPSPANDGRYAQPGVYTMNVKYVLREN